MDGLVVETGCGHAAVADRRDLGAVSMVLVGIIEEAAELIVPFIVYLFLRPKDPRAGGIIGIAPGMGFATLETMGYGFQALLSAGSISAVAVALHATWDGTTSVPVHIVVASIGLVVLLVFLPRAHRPRRDSVSATPVTT